MCVSVSLYRVPIFEWNGTFVEWPGEGELEGEPHTPQPPAGPTDSVGLPKCPVCAQPRTGCWVQ